MKKGRTKSTLTEKEEQIMQLLWTHGPLHVKEMVVMYPEPRPHVNTISTLVRILEQKGFVAHNDEGGSYQYYAVAALEDFRRSRLGSFIRNYFGNSYVGAVSALVEEEKISIDELRELIDMVEKKNKS